MLPETITPTRYARERKVLHEFFAEMRADIGEARRLRATGRLLDAEEADGILVMLPHKHDITRARLRWLRAVRVEKYSHVSPNAAKRLARG